jgi:hypothetical protein
MRKLKNAYLRVVRLNYKLVDYLLFYTYYITDSGGKKLSVNEELALTAQNTADLISLVPMKRAHGSGVLLCMANYIKFADLFFDLHTLSLCLRYTQIMKIFYHNRK